MPISPIPKTLNSLPDRLFTPTTLQVACKKTPSLLALALPVLSLILKSADLRRADRSLLLGEPGENMKYILVSGGVISGVGKGILASSIGALLHAYGFRTTAIKIDPYINIDAGTFSPYEHGEVFVLDDGGEVDLDLGNYERFMDISLQKDNNITSGKIYQSVIKSERRGDYLGKTVQVVPHITNEIQSWVERVAKESTTGEKDAEPEICVIELGGTIGSIESMPFVEAFRQFRFKEKKNFAAIHVSLVINLVSIFLFFIPTIIPHLPLSPAASKKPSPSKTPSENYAN